MMVTSPVVESALKTADIARVLPHEGMILLVWTLGGFLTLAGALTYAELGALYPRAGGMYHYLKEAYGTFWGFLYGWACFLVIMSGGIAALALPLDAIAETARIGETAAAALFGDGSGRLMSFAILVSTFGGLLFHVGTAGAVIVLRRRRPDVERSYRVWGYPWVPLLFILASILLVGNTLVEKPAESLFGLVLIAAGVPAYMWWRRHPTPDSEVKS